MICGFDDHHKLSKKTNIGTYSEVMYYSKAKL